jgi:hypothetical protein
MSDNNNDNDAQNECNDVLYLGGLFFLKASIIKENTELVQQTFQDMFQQISSN